MNGNAINLIIFVVLIMHGIGHYMGIYSAFGGKLSKQSSYQSRIFSGMNDTLARILCFVLYAFALAGTILAALSFQELLLPYVWWETLAVSSAIISLLAMILFWNGLATLFNKVGAMVVNLLIILSVWWWHWPAEIFLK